MIYFQTLGDRIGATWKLLNYNEKLFSTVALEALIALPPSQHTSMAEVVDYGISTEELPEQPDILGVFGDPPFTVYNGRGFRIDVLFWLIGQPTIHEHGFSGAFHVMAGSSVHVRWAFEIEERVNSQLLIGNASFLGAEILRAGDSREIIAGSRFIHSTFHLDKPSISVVVRTNREMDKLPQLTYLPPSIAYDSTLIIPSVHRRVQLLAMLYGTGQYEQYVESLLGLIEREDLAAIFWYLRGSRALIKDAEARLSLLQVLERKHQKLGNALRRSFAEEDRAERIADLRSQVLDPALRFFLALVMNLPDYKSLRTLVELFEPGRDSTDAVLGWIKTLLDQGLLGSELPPATLRVLKCMILGWTDEQIESTFVAYGTAAVKEIERIKQIVKVFWLFEPLLR